MQSASRGRLVLGIGAGHRVTIEGRFGLDYGGPARHLDECLAVLAPLLASESVSHRGPRIGAALKLDVADAKPPPIVLAALGPEMLKLAGRAADGVAIWLGNPHFLESFALPRLHRAARDTGRPLPRVACALPIAVCRDPVAARRSAGQLIASSARLPAYQNLLRLGDVTDPSHVAIVGDEDSVASQLDRLADLGVDDFNAVTYAVQGDENAQERTIEFLGSIADG